MLKGAIVGFGNVAEFGHWPGYAGSSEVEIVAVVDSLPGRSARATTLSQSLGIFPSLTEIEEEAIDFVDICTPPALHAEPVLEAIARGWHVLCEKPFLLDQSVLDQVREQALRKNLAAIPVHNWKHAPIIRAASKLLRAGEIGELRELQITTLRVRAAATAAAVIQNWRLDSTLAGGGILMDHGWHAIYLARHWFGEDPVASQVELHWSANAPIDDEAVLMLEFPSGRARIELSWNAPHRSNQIRLQGTRSEIFIDDDTLVINHRARQFPSALSAGSHHPDWFAAMLPEILAAIRNPALSRPGLEEAAVCLTTINAAYEQASARR